MRVGRPALDEQAIRFIEEHHPDIRFDWTQILKGEEEAPGRPEPRPSRDQGAARPREPRPSPRPESAAADAPPAEPISPAHAQLGSEGLARLRARYADVMAAITSRVVDPDRREQLKTDAERLNPDGWVTSEEVRLALDQYEAVLESLREAIGRRRRRRRSRGGGGSPESGQQAGESDASSPPPLEPRTDDDPSASDDPGKDDDGAS